MDPGEFQEMWNAKKAYDDKDKNALEKIPGAGKVASFAKGLWGR